LDAVKNSPVGHAVFFAVHSVTALVPTLNSVDLQAVQLLSKIELPDAVKYWPAAHAVFFAAHDVTASALPRAGEYLKSAESQGVHVASAVADPAVKYSPIQHENCLLSVHVASAVLSADFVKNAAAGHSVFFAVHSVSASRPTLNSVDLQAVHQLSAVELPDAVKYWPAGHHVLFTGHHVYRLEPTLNLPIGARRVGPDAQATHVSAHCAFIAVKNLPAGHVVDFSAQAVTAS
jgi:hypothetical protein